MVRLKPLIISIIIPLGVGGVVALLTMNSMNIYKTLNLPNFSPPSLAFPIVWTILYIFMGISWYMIYESSFPIDYKSLVVYTVQLIFNFIWPLIFFNGRMYFFSLIWLVALWILVLVMIVLFYRIKKSAAYLQIPYLMWLTFAAYLNLGIYLLN